MKRTLAVLAVLSLPAAAWAAIPAGGGTVDLATTFDGRLRGDVQLTGVVQAVGDFDGDGGGDLAAVHRAPNGIRVVAGGVLTGDRGVNATAGFTLTSARTLTTVAGAGDVNGDGKADLVVGSCDPGAADPGRAWIVFGRSGSGSVDLDGAFGGFRVEGNGTECLGRAVAGAGDFNKDGRADVIIGAHKAATNDGRAIVVFGKADEGAISSASLGGAGFDLLGHTVGDTRAGVRVAGLGDVNGDGFADVGVGGEGYDDGPYGTDAGAVWVVHGRAGSGSLQLDTLSRGNTTGFRVDGQAGGRAAAVAPAGDVNNDGKADFAVGGPGPNNPGVVGVIFGRAETTALTIASLGPSGYRFTSNSGSSLFGFDLRGGADVNGDGRPDVLAGAPGAAAGSSPERLEAGKVFVLFGRATGDNATNVDSATFDSQGVRLLGPRGAQSTAADTQGSAVGGEGAIGIGDVTCDGRADVLAGMATANAGNGVTDPGAAYIQLGTGGSAIACGGGGGGGGGGGTTGGSTGGATTGGGTPPGPPAITGAKLSPRKFRVGRRPTAIKSARKRKPTPFGTKVRFRLSEPATVNFVITCDRPRGAKLKKACRTLAKKNTIVREVATAGAQVFSFTGRIGKKALPIAKFKLTILAADADNERSAPVTLRFRTVRR